MTVINHQWIRHEKGLNYSGQSVCLRCKVELPAVLPVNQTVCTKEDRLYLGDIQGSMNCDAV